MSRDKVITKEELNLILLLDNSYSMVNGRIAQLNSAIPTLKNNLIKVADENNVNVKLRVITFSDNPTWKVGSITEGVDISSVVWQDIGVENNTHTHKAILEANKALKAKHLGQHALRPVVILVTDGNCEPTYHKNYLEAIEKMKNALSDYSGNEKVTRVAIGVEDFNREELEEFASMGLISDQLRPLVFEINKSADISKVINWVAVTSLMASIANEGDIVDIGDAEWGEDDE